SDAFTKWDDVRYGLRKESLASRGLGKLLERLGLLVRVIVRINANGIDDGVGFPRHLQDLAQIIFAGIIAPVAHHDQDLFVPVSLLQVLDCSRQGVVERRFAGGLKFRQGSLQLPRLVREGHVGRKAKRYMLVEIDDEHLVLRIAGAGKRQGSGNNFGALGCHASTVVQNQARRDRNIFMTIIFSLLQRAVLVDLKVLLAEPRNRSAFMVLHGRVQDYTRNIYTDFVGVNRAKFGSRGFLRA